jgi:hypothetical protein
VQVSVAKWLQQTECHHERGWIVACHHKDEVIVEEDAMLEKTMAKMSCRCSYWTFGH